MNRFFSLISRTLAAFVFVACFMFVAKTQAQAACTIGNPSLTGTLSVGSECPTISGESFTGPAPAGTTSDSGCVGYSQGRADKSFPPGDHTPSPGAGQCQQFDFVYNGKTYGVAKYGGGTAGGGGLVCGEKCTSSSQCRNPSGNGSPVACINGTCQNTMCAEGMTIPGGNCSCGANTRKCGQTCSGTVGLCGPGQGTCTYVNPPKHWYTGQPDCAWGSTAYCAGSSNGYSHVQCPATDTGDGGGTYLRNPAGAVNGLDVADIPRSCQICGNGEVEMGEQCDDGALNGNISSCSCTKSCEFFSMALTANGATNTVTVTSGSSVTLAWQTAGMTACAGVGGWSGGKAVVGTETISNVTANTQFDLQCSQAGTGRQVVVSVNVNVAGKTAAPTIDFKINKSNGPIVYTNPVNWATQFGVTNAAFTWTTTGATSCVGQTFPSPQTVYPFPGGVPYTWSTAVAGWFLFDQAQPVQKTTAGSLSIINDAGASKYGYFVLSCTGAGGTTQRRILVSTDTTPSRATCSQPATPAPTPAPTSTPLVCDLTVNWTSNANATAWKYGDMITFSTSAVPSARIPSGGSVRYEGQVQAYRGTTQVKSVSLTPINATAAQFQPMKVDVANATYYFRFRYCVKTSAGVETCSNWGAWASPSGN